MLNFDISCSFDKVQAHCAERGDTAADLTAAMGNAAAKVLGFIDNHSSSFGVDGVRMVWSTKKPRA